MVKLAAFIVGDQATGEDVVQDVFARLHQRWDMLADPGDPLPYLRTAVVNGCRSAIRRRGRAQRHAGHDSPSPPLSTEESVLLSEDRQQVLAALAGLSRRRLRDRSGAGWAACAPGWFPSAPRPASPRSS